MSDISISQAAFAGFSAMRRSPATLLVWYVVSVAIGALGVYLAGRLVGPAMAELQAVQTAVGPPNQQAALVAMGRMMGGLLLLIPAYLVLGAITTTAANRAVLQPDQSAFGYLRLGSDELRMIVVLLVVGIILFVIYMVGVIIASVVATAASGALSGGQPDPLKMAATIYIALVPVIIVCALLALKFALAPAQTLDTHAISIFGSWGLTRGRFGATFLTYLLAGVIFVVLYAVLIWLSLASAAAVSGKTMAQMMRPDVATAFALNDPSMIVRLLFGGVIAVLGQLLLVCPGAALYEQITGRSQEEAF